MRIGYKRIMKSRQADYDPQLWMETLETERIFTDFGAEKTQLQKLLKYCEPGDIIVVDSLKELAAAKREIIDVLQHLAMKGAFIEARQEGIDTYNQQGDMLLQILSLMGEASGKKLQVEEAPDFFAHPVRDDFDSLYEDYKNGSLSKIELRKKLGLSLAAINKLIADKETNG